MGRWSKGYDVGVVERHVGNRVIVTWDYNSGPIAEKADDVKYWHERGLLKIIRPKRSKRSVEPSRIKHDEDIDAGAPVNYTMHIKSNRGEKPPISTEEKNTMATLTAKEAAQALGTDGRTLRKFLRSKTSPIPACGAGNRYEIEKKDMKALKKAFDAWHTPKPTEDKPAKKTKAQKVEEDEVIDEVEDLDDIEMELEVDEDEDEDDDEESEDEDDSDDEDDDD